jgi:hypothetical protein
MSWTQAELDALKAAYASGTTRVTYEGKTVEYDTEAALLRRIQTVEASINSAAGTPSPVAGYASFGRGDR